MNKEEQIKALAEFLGVEPEEISEGFDDNSFTVFDGETYLVLDEEGADAKAREEIEYSLWAFNADFIIQHCKNYDEMDNYEYQSAIESLRHAQENCCENANGLVRALIDDMDEFVDDAITADGRGHFISKYDGEENEMNGFYIYRVD
jgi:hypothetical protein